MTIYSLYIFDRHCTCVYYHDWHRTKLPKTPAKGGILPAVSRTLTPHPDGATGSQYGSPRNTLLSTSGVVVAVNEDMPRTPTPAAQQALSTQQQQQQQQQQPNISILPFDEEAKLVYGVILSLRTMVKKLSKREEQFTNYRTSTYKLHLFETLSGYKFVLLTDPRSDSMRALLRQIYAGPFLDYVVRNPLTEMDSKERGIDNEYFRTSTDRIMRSMSNFS